MAKKNITIPNWTFFSVKKAILDLYKHINPDNQEVHYNVVVSYILDDGNDNENTDDLKCISIITDINVLTIDEAIDEATDSIGGLFKEFHAIVTIYDAKTMNSLQEIDLNDYFDSDIIDNDSDDLDDLTIKTTPPGTVIH